MQLLTVKDLAERWQKDVGTIRRYIADGVITPCSGVPSTMFNIQYIEKLEDVELNPMSPWERKKLLDKIKELEHKNESLRKVLGNILAESAKIINM